LLFLFVLLFVHDMQFPVEVDLVNQNVGIHTRA
jgi:hypothetical protein